MTNRIIILLIILAGLTSSARAQFIFAQQTFPANATCADDLELSYSGFFFNFANYVLDSTIVDVQVGQVTVDFYFSCSSCSSGIQSFADTIIIGNVPAGINNFELNLYENGVWSAKDTLLNDTIAVCCPAQAHLQTDTLVCNGGTLNMTDTSSFGTAWWWKENGVTFSTNPFAASRTFTTPGYYQMRLVTGDGTCVDSTEVTVGVKLPPTAQGFTSVHANRDVQFTDTSKGNWNSTYQWTFGDGDSSLQQNPMHTFPDTGNYVVCLEIENMCGSDSICKTETVSCPRPTANFTYSVDSLTIVLKDTSLLGLSYFWTFGDGAFTGIQDPTYTYANPGIYNVCLMTTNDCGTDTLCQDVNIGNFNSTTPLNVYNIEVAPNPFTNRLTAIGLPPGNYTAKLVGILGTEIVTPLHQGELILDLPAGAYILQILDKDRVIYRKRVISF